MGTPRLTTAGVGMDVATHTARGPLMPSPLLSLRPSLRPGTAMAATAPPVTAMATARGPLMPMPTTAMAVAMDTDTARGPLMLMPTTAGEAMAAVTMASAPLMPRLTTAGEAMDVATPTARGP